MKVIIFTVSVTGRWGPPWQVAMGGGGESYGGGLLEEESEVVSRGGNTRLGKVVLSMELFQCLVGRIRRKLVNSLKDVSPACGMVQT